jgi:hypothetical protein
MALNKYLLLLIVASKCVQAWLFKRNIPLARYDTQTYSYSTTTIDGFSAIDEASLESLNQELAAHPGFELRHARVEDLGPISAILVSSFIGDTVWFVSFCMREVRRLKAKFPASAGKEQPIPLIEGPELSLMSSAALDHFMIVAELTDDDACAGDLVDQVVTAVLTLPSICFKATRGHQ